MTAVGEKQDGNLELIFEQFLQKEDLPERYAATARQWFLPLASQIAAAQLKAGKTLLVGVNGSQGSGKSTLCALLREVLQSQYGLSVADLSIDDFYLTHAERQTLARDIHPLLATRGVPGTHDVDLLTTVLEQLISHEGPVRVPRFDKATDDRVAPDHWSLFTAPLDVVLVEGWCMGITHQSPVELATPVNALEADDDGDAVWRHWVNEQLLAQYEPLYGRFDFWVMLQAPGFDCIHRWRLEQENKLRDRLGKQAGSPHIMSEAAIARFIQHYQRLTEHGLRTLPDRVNVLFRLDEEREIMDARHFRERTPG
ncbi:conserved hypothetical protein [Luminiphilus syltensis NOR5-1B]|uniref:Kinase n=1 Tax=Luminiphilus syltensis NOR5-1B TaxID=565045 RepID=B8KTK8_9GAMM|nr:hypothetical protein [Luminiphilus syltensis]EED34802.1 conserved hypothetical protein [Luminiphilus syltensis NOR5-1B]